MLEKFHTKKMNSKQIVSLIYSKPCYTTALNIQQHHFKCIYIYIFHSVYEGSKRIKFDLKFIVRYNGPEPHITLIVTNIVVCFYAKSHITINVLVVVKYTNLFDRIKHLSLNKRMKRKVYILIYKCTIFQRSQYNSSFSLSLY